MQVGHIPSLTWNKLSINEGTIRKDIKCNTAVKTVFETLPEGVSSKEMTAKEVQEWLSVNSPKQPREAVVAGKTPIYHPQEFATGLGKEFDDFAMENCGSVEFFEVAKNVNVKDPIRWNIDFNDNNEAAAGMLIHVCEGAKLILVMSSHSHEDAKGMAGISTKVVLDEDAEMTLVKVQLLGSNFDHFDDIGACLKEKAQLNIIELELGGNDVYTGMQTELSGNGSGLNVKCGYTGRRGQNVDINFNVVHRGKKTVSEMSFDGVLDGRAQKRLSDTIDFRRGSKGSVGHESENVLLLSDDIVNKSLPVILCEEEDMEGSHGATIGKLDDDMLFYMASRGINEEEAQKIMVRARLMAVARDIPDEKLKKEIEDYIEEAFKA